MPTTPVSGLPLRSFAVPLKRTRRGRADAVGVDVCAPFSDTNDKNAATTQKMRSFMRFSPLRKTKLGFTRGPECLIKARSQALGRRERASVPKTCRGLCLLVLALSSCKKLHGSVSTRTETRHQTTK